MSEWRHDEYGMPVFIHRGIPVYLSAGWFVVPLLERSFAHREDAFKAIDKHLDSPRPQIQTRRRQAVMDMRRIAKVDHPLIEEWAHKHWALEKEIRDAVQKMTDSEIQALEHAATSLTSINCWYAEADVKPLVIDAIGFERGERSRKRQSAALHEEGSKK